MSVASGKPPKYLKIRAFPGYIYLQLEPSLLRLLGRFLRQRYEGAYFLSKKPRPQEEIDRLRALSQKTPAPLLRYTPGDSIQVRHGLWSGFVAIVVESDEQKQRLWASLEILGGAMKIQLNFHQVQRTDR
jgi:transcription antitermination factor NusG